MVKKIAILTSGGDCAGLNAVIRAVTLRAHNKYNWEVYGIKDGTLGLLKEPLDVIKLNPQNFEVYILMIIFLNLLSYKLRANQPENYSLPLLFFNPGGVHGNST